MCRYTIWSPNRLQDHLFLSYADLCYSPEPVDGRLILEKICEIIGNANHVNLDDAIMDNEVVCLTHTNKHVDALNAKYLLKSKEGKKVQYLREIRERKELRGPVGGIPSIHYTLIVTSHIRMLPQHHKPCIQVSEGMQVMCTVNMADLNAYNGTMFTFESYDPETERCTCPRKVSPCTFPESPSSPW